MTRLAYVALVAGVAFLLGLSGCGSITVLPVGEDPAPAGADAAAYLVWASYGGAPAALPSVTWTSARECPAWTPGAPLTPGWVVSGACLSGEALSPALVLVGRWGDTPLALTELAHELCHAWSGQATGDMDVTHVGPCFVPGGKVDAAVAALAAAEGVAAPPAAGANPVFRGSPP